MGLEELIEQAMELINTDDDFLACCNKPRHRARFLSRAMVAVSTERHKEHVILTPYFAGAPRTVETCGFFPCRLIREFGDLDGELDS